MVSNLLLWCVIVVMGVVIAALVRQLGVLNARVAPVGALAGQEGVRVGEAAPQMSAESLAGVPVEIGGPRTDGRATLLFFLSPSCPVCETLLPALQSMARLEAQHIEVILASDGEPEAHRRFVAEEKLEHMPYLLSPGLGIAYGVSKLPFAAGIRKARRRVAAFTPAKSSGITQPARKPTLPRRGPSAATHSAGRARSRREGTWGINARASRRRWGNSGERSASSRVRCSPRSASKARESRLRRGIR